MSSHVYPPCTSPRCLARTFSCICGRGGARERPGPWARGVRQSSASPTIPAVVHRRLADGAPVQCFAAPSISCSRVFTVTLRISPRIHYAHWNLITLSCCLALQVTHRECASLLSSRGSPAPNPLPAADTRRRTVQRVPHAVTTSLCACRGGSRYLRLYSAVSISHSPNPIVPSRRPRTRLPIVKEDDLHHGIAARSRVVRWAWDPRAPADLPNAVLIGLPEKGLSGRDWTVRLDRRAYGEVEGSRCARCVSAVWL